MDEAEAESILVRITSFPHIRIQGLMGMAEFTENMGVVQSQFQRLAAARDRLKALEGPQIELKELSMGMSGDFEVAIAEGATLVRIGSSIFGGR
jgi:PLP dependent protein